MRGILRLVVAAVSFAVVGFGQAVAGRRRAAITWALAWVAATWLTVVTPWFVVVALTISIACVIDAFERLGKASDVKLVQPFAIAVGAFIIVARIALRFCVMDKFMVPTSSMYPTLWIEDHVVVDRLSLHWRSPEPGEVIAFTYPCNHAEDYIKRVIAVAGDHVEIRCNKVYVNDHVIADRLVSATYDFEDRIEDGNWVAANASEYHERLGDHDYDVLHDPGRPARDRDNAAGPNAHAAPHDFPPLNGNPFAPTCAQTSDGAASSEQVRGTIEVAKRADPNPCEPQVHYVVPANSLFVLGDNRNNSNDSRVWGAVPLSLVKGRVTSVYWHGGRGDSWGRIGSVE